MKTFTSHDRAVWHTIWINDLIAAGAWTEIEGQATSFPPQLGHDEVILAGSPFALFAWEAGGDGSYLHRSGGGGFLIGTRPAYLAAGLAGMAAGAAARAAGNSRRRRQAEAEARERWRCLDQGGLYVSQHGFYLQSTLGLRTWSYDAVLSSDLIGPGHVLIAGNSTDGPIQWVVESDWAELLFTLWARRRHPRHPQYVGGTWVPEGWQARAARSPYGLPQLRASTWQHLLPPGGPAQ